MAVKVFIDANLLFYKIISDLLFDSSSLGLIDAYWSQAVIDEYLEHGPRVLNEVRKSRGQEENHEIAKGMIEKKVELFKAHSGFNLVEDYDSVEIPDDSLKDKDDIHVLKAAIKSDCSVLLTLDAGFRKISSLEDLKIVAKKADELFCELFDHEEDRMMDVIEETRKGIERQQDRDIDLAQLVEMMKEGELEGLAQKVTSYLA